MSDLQRTPQWYLDRLGKVGASRVADVVATVRSGGYGSTRGTYMTELLLERLTGTPTQSYINASMQWGIDNETPARAAYEFLMDYDVTQVGFIPHPKIINAGASPDGLIGKDGLVEIKCPDSKTHVETLLEKKIPERYVTQIQFQLATTGRQWCDYFSYDPRFPGPAQIFRHRVVRNNPAIAKLEKEVRLFLTELDGKVAALARECGITPKVLAA